MVDMMLPTEDKIGTWRRKGRRRGARIAEENTLIIWSRWRLIDRRLLKEEKIGGEKVDGAADGLVEEKAG
jgi:hypothetical protein